MSYLGRKGLLEILSVNVQSKRFRGKINLRRPQQPHHERAVYLDVCKPIVVRPKPTVVLCDKDIKRFNQDAVENPLQRIFANELLDLFKKSKLIAFFHMNPMNAEQHYKAKLMFHKHKMLYMNYGRKTMEMAVKGTIYEAVLSIYISHNMLVFSEEANIKNLFKVAKKFPQLILLAGVFEGRFVRRDELEKYSNIPTLQAAQSELVQTLQSIGGDIVQKLNTHQQTLVSQLDERMKQLDVK